MLDHDLQMPTRRFISGVLETKWRRPDAGLFYRLVTSPIYAGAYAYGRAAQQIEYVDGESRKTTRRKARKDWSVLIRHHHEGYVAWG